jgi:hypothetical protein
MRIKNCKILSLFIILITLSCKPLKPYERVYIDDKEMQLGNTPAKNFDGYVRSIREGATPPASSKASGGCGCN